MFIFEVERLIDEYDNVRYHVYALPVFKQENNHWFCSGQNNVVRKISKDRDGIFRTYEEALALIEEDRNYDRSKSFRRDGSSGSPLSSKILS